MNAPRFALCAAVLAACITVQSCVGNREGSPLPKDIARRELPAAEEGSRRAASMALVKRAQDALRARRTREAKSWLESAIALDARNPYAYHLLALMAYDARDTTQAEALFQKARDCYRNGDDWETECALLLGVTAERRKHWFTAKRAYEDALSRSPDHPRAKRGYANAKKRLDAETQRSE